MPELPEVEIVRRRLHPRVTGRVVTAVEVADAKVSPSSAAELHQAFTGRRIVDTARRGKWLILQLGPAEVAPTSAGPPDLAAGSPPAAGPAAAGPAAVQEGPVEMLAVVHLRMTGRLLFEPDAERPRCCPRFTLRFDDGSKVFFYDVRRFGGLWAVPAAHADRFFAGLGIEPLSDDFTVGELRSLLAGRRTPLKAFLLDQRRLAGVGNIYADEALFRARLHPLRPAGSVGPREAQRLHAAVRETLQLGIDHEGSSVESFVDPAGDRGRFQEILNVYQRTGEPCRACGTPIRRITLGGRGTHFCPRCQPRRGMRLRPAPKE
jgi:formamidopyrimidine-DNA glycosylase